MRVSKSIWLKGFLTIVAAAGFIWLYEISIPDSRFSMLPLGFEVLTDPDGQPQPGVRMAFSATAYCKGQVTASGVAVQEGAVAADPTILPGGSVISVDVGNPTYDGIYTVLDTGPEIKGREIDVYMWSCYEALDFGRRPAFVTVIRLGWNPHVTTPSLVDRIFRRPAPRAGAKPPAPEPTSTASPEPMPEPELTPPPEPLEARPLPLIPSVTEK